jgi:hypothetical protein
MLCRWLLRLLILLTIMLVCMLALINKIINRSPLLKYQCCIIITMQILQQQPNPAVSATANSTATAINQLKVFDNYSNCSIDSLKNQVYRLLYLFISFSETYNLLYCPFCIYEYIHYYHYSNTKND